MRRSLIISWFERAQWRRSRRERSYHWPEHFSQAFQRFFNLPGKLISLFHCKGYKEAQHQLLLSLIHEENTINRTPQ
jgi:hypothetical protein